MLYSIFFLKNGTHLNVEINTIHLLFVEEGIH